MRYLTIVVLFILFYSPFLFAQPYWVKNKTIEHNSQYYFGIGVSDISEVAADDAAYINFGKIIEIKVQSITERILDENKSGITDITLNSTKIESDDKLKGITITERFYNDDSQKTFLFNQILYICV